MASPKRSDTPQAPIVTLEPRYLTLKEAAQYLGMTPKAVRHMVFRRQIPCAKRGRRLHFDRLDLDAWMHGLKRSTVEQALQGALGWRRT